MMKALLTAVIAFFVAFVVVSGMINNNDNNNNAPEARQAAANHPTATDTPDAPRHDPACRYNDSGVRIYGDTPSNCPFIDPDQRAQLRAKWDADQAEEQRRRQWEIDHDAETQALARRRLEQSCDNLRAVDPEAWGVSYACQHL
jgi:hypothetical protein